MKGPALPCYNLGMETIELIELPVLTRKEEKEDKGGAAPLPLYFGANGAVQLAGAPLSIGRAGLFATLFGARGGALPGFFGGSTLPTFAALLTPLAALVLYTFFSGSNTESPALVSWGFGERAAEQPASRRVATVSGLELMPEGGRLQAAAIEEKEKPAAEDAEEAVPAPEADAAKGLGIDLESIGINKEDVAAAAKKAKGFGDGFGRGFGRDGNSRIAGGSPGPAAASSALLGARSGLRTVSASGSTSRTKAFRRNRQPARGGRRIAESRRNPNSLSQLKFARNFSSAGAQQTRADSARAFSADAFDQSTTENKDAGTISVPGDADALPPVGGGAPDLTSVPNPDLGRNVTPFQNKLDNAKKGMDMGKLLGMIGMMLMLAGIALLAMAKSLPGPWQKPAMIAGIMMIIAGIAMMSMGKKKANDAKDKGKQIEQKDGQKEQGELVQDCADAAAARQDCRPNPIRERQNTIRDDIQRLNAAHPLENGAPIAAPGPLPVAR